MEEHFYGKKAIEKAAKMFTLKPDLMQAYLDFDGKVFADGKLSTKTKELVAVACAHITQCPYCIEGHTERAKKAGATDEEIAEAIFVAVAIRAGGSMAHSCIAMDALDE
ncbi:MAG: carboxymuconolactone decarboxylase family protein [Chloroflexi bacterium]|nr:carboxymuconolactone decarboxylase family protein [Chloroflexota bacterium]MBM3173371.1 carboxymuconolactone decarboxylase family protein [Chloroflexota bacterium]MBM3174360.1 carboxymuconolactone decarboxylase family protein [Chloroflexota bacterium]MBM4450961.1 carboxymuconolactone decarboxylase family protein [Chloroflexota bacterium]